MNEIKANRITNENSIDQNHTYYGMLLCQYPGTDTDTGTESFFKYYVKDSKPYNGAELWPDYMQERLLQDYDYFNSPENLLLRENLDNFINERKKEQYELNISLLSFFGMGIISVFIYASMHIFG